MRAPEFWWAEHPSPLARTLRPLGAIHGAITARRMARPGSLAAVPVVCVGNLVAGGAGKTPTALAVAQLLAGAGERPFLLTRGHGGREPGPLRVDPARHGPDAVGDEPLLLSSAFPTIVARDRVAGARLAAARGASLVVMDDGLQNPGLVKDVALAVIDAAVGVGNGLCIPAGPLRAPVAAQMPLIDAVILIGEGIAGERAAALATVAGKPVFRAALAIAAAAGTALAGRRVLAVSGIGRPGKFEQSLRGAGAVLAGHRVFGDHHAYRPGDVAGLIAEADRLGCAVATTEKDAVKLRPLWPARGPELIVVPVDLVFADLAGFAAFLGAGLAPARFRPGVRPA